MMSNNWGASRATIATSWRLAASVARRHPDTLIYEMHPAGGMYDVLHVGTSESPLLGRAHAMLNRVGTIQVHDGEPMQMPWPNTGDPEGLRAAVLAIEGATGWGSPSTTPAATPRTLAYRFIAAALELLLFDRVEWDARSAFHDSSVDSYVRDIWYGFPFAQAELGQLSRHSYSVHPAARFWSLERDGETLLIVSDSGKLHRRATPPVDLTQAYIDEGRRMRRTALVQVAEWL